MDRIENKLEQFNERILSFEFKLSVQEKKIEDFDLSIKNVVMS